MAVANSTVIKKMMRELEQALIHAENEPQMLKYIENVKLLCDLFLQDEVIAANKEELKTEEWKALIGKQTGPAHRPAEKTANDHDGANGDSIFDF